MTSPQEPPAMAELLPCPFCRGKAKHAQYFVDKGHGDGYPEHWVECSNPECRTSIRKSDHSLDAAANRWNARAPSLAADVEALKSEVWQHVCDTAPNCNKAWMPEAIINYLAANGHLSTTSKCIPKDLVKPLIDALETTLWDFQTHTQWNGDDLDTIKQAKATLLKFKELHARQSSGHEDAPPVHDVEALQRARGWIDNSVTTPFEQEEYRTICDLIDAALTNAKKGG